MAFCFAFKFQFSCSNLEQAISDYRQVLWSRRLFRRQEDKSLVSSKQLQGRTLHALSQPFLCFRKLKLNTIFSIFTWTLSRGPFFSCQVLCQYGEQSITNTFIKIPFVYSLVTRSPLNLLFCRVNNTAAFHLHVKVLLLPSSCVWR